MPSPSISYKRHRFPAQIIAPAVWLYIRSNLSLREVEEMLLKRGIDVPYVTVQVLDPLANRLGNVVPDP